VHGALAGTQLERVGEVTQQRAQRDAPLRYHMLVEFDPRQRQQVLDQPDHPGGLLVHDRKKSLARLGILARRASQSFDKPGQSRQWRAQFVARIGDEIAAHLLGSFQLSDIVQGQHRDRVGVRRGAVDTGKMRLQLPLDRSGERKLDHPRCLAGQDRIGRGQHSGVAECGREVVRPLDNAKERLRLRVGVNHPPPRVEQDQRIWNGGDHRLRGG